MLPPKHQDQMLVELRKREKIIRQVRDAWQAGPTALLEIRDNRFYHAEGYTDFGRYCREKLHIGKSTINRQLAISEVYKALASTGAETLPTSERQLRPLLFLREPQQEPAIWAKSVASVWTKVVHEAEITKKPLTQKSVVRALRQLGLVQKSTDFQPELEVEKRWARLKVYLEHEREFWSVECRPVLSERIINLVGNWEPNSPTRPPARKQQ
ncbi:MAG TPA: hypothetical protein VGO67_14990 [Verrucomicrobiae bacterium]